MSIPLTLPTEADVLQATAKVLTTQRSSAALDHYPTLRIQTQNLHKALVDAIKCVDDIIDEWSEKLSAGAEVTSEFQVIGSPKYFYCTIAPILVRNLHQTADFLLEEARAVAAVSMDQVVEIIPSFSAFVRLGASVRGFLDALVQTAYQLATFDGLQLNYKFLQSLLSFAAVAPRSLHANIGSPGMQEALNAYTSLSKKARKDSSFTKASHEQFPQRLLIASELVGLPEHQRQNIDLLFGFCSDFVHSGYVTVLAIAGENPEFVMGGPDDAFTPKAENFAELKLRLLSECAGAYVDLLVPVLKKAVDLTLVGGAGPDWVKAIDTSTDEVRNIRKLLYRRLIKPVRKGGITSKSSLRVECVCGAHSDLRPHHSEWDRFCHGCGSRFEFLELPDEVDYVVSRMGVGDVLGGDAPKIEDLDVLTRSKLDRIAEKHKPEDGDEAVNFVLITDLNRCDEENLSVPTILTHSPAELDKSKCTLFSFVAEKSFARCSTVRITCNCGADVEYSTIENSYVCKCSGCQAVIGLMGVSGDVNSVSILNQDGTPGSAPVQARNRFGAGGIATN